MQKILIATSNHDKFNRIKNWIRSEFNLPILSMNDLSSDLKEKSLLTSVEELNFLSMIDRALAKVTKPFEALKSEGEFIIFASDESCYFPWINTEILDVRMPPEIRYQEQIVANKTNERLTGAQFANHYADIVDRVADISRMKEVVGEVLPEYKFMPIVWKFALSAISSSKPDARIIAEWQFTQYIKNTKLPENTPDTGYMIGKISVTDPLYDVTEIKNFKNDEVAREAIGRYLE